VSIRRSVATGRILRVGLRLSVVVAALAGVWDAYRRYSDALADVRAGVRMQMSYECAAKASDADLLNRHINIREAPFYCADRESTVAASIIGFVGTNLLALPIAALVIVVRWVLGPLSKPT
jgi:hypothetical protein